MLFSALAEEFYHSSNQNNQLVPTKHQFDLPQYAVLPFSFTFSSWSTQEWENSTVQTNQLNSLLVKSLKDFETLLATQPPKQYGMPKGSVSSTLHEAVVKNAVEADAASGRAKTETESEAKDAVDLSTIRNRKDGEASAGPSRENPLSSKHKVEKPKSKASSKEESTSVQALASLYDSSTQKENVEGEFQIEQAKIQAASVSIQRRWREIIVARRMRWLRKRHIASTKITRMYRGYTVRSFMWEWKRLYNKAAIRYANH